MNKLLILLFSILVSFNSFADYQDGQDAYDRGDYKAAFNDWHKAAEQAI